jgi:hypothetical protein
MGSHQPTPLGIDGHSPVIDTGTSTLHGTPAPTFSSGHERGGREQRALVFDGERLDRLFRSTAHALALARHIKARPMQSDAKDSFGVKAIVTVMPDAWLPQEVELPDDGLLALETKKGANQFGEYFWTQLDSGGARAVVTFLNDVEAQRENALDKVQSVYREALKQTEKAVEIGGYFKAGLATVKCASTIVVAGLTLPVAATVTGLAAAGSLASFAVGTSYAVSLKVIKSWSEAPQADVVLVAAEKAAQKTGQKATKEVAKALQNAYEGEAQDLARAERKIEWLTKRVKGTDLARDRSRLATAERAAATARGAGQLAKALRTVPYLFFVWSVVDAGSTFHDDLSN